VRATTDDVRNRPRLDDVDKLPLVPSFHHANISVPEGGADAESAFLVDLLGYRRLQPTPEVTMQVWWFASDDGREIHLSENAEHQVTPRTHLALDLGDDLAALERRLDLADYRYKAVDVGGRRTVLCKDPAGNRWELRGTPQS
jgi:catechol 2,3-dioxygenase-like lactoylglutathione lyase family enzyme